MRAGEEIDFTVEFTPTTPGIAEAATIRIRSNDPGAPEVDLLASGLGGTASAHVVVPDNGEFGEVCLGEFMDRDLVVNNAGECQVEIFGVTSSVADFVVPSALPSPVAVAPGASVDLPVRFEPRAVGAASTLLRVFSNDPTSPATVHLRGVAPAPRLVLSIADSGNFDAVCVGDFRDDPLTIANSAPCPLTVTGLASSSPEFLLPDVDALPMIRRSPPGRWI